MTDAPHPTDDLLLFAPVPLARVTARGWSPVVQREFIRALARTGMVAAAARSVARSPRSAYLLRVRVGADGFAAAWDQAIEVAFETVREGAVRVIAEPERVPILYRGRIVGWRERFNERLAIAALKAIMAERDGPLPPHRRRIAARALAAAADRTARIRAAAAAADRADATPPLPAPAPVIRVRAL